MSEKRPLVEKPDPHGQDFAVFMKEFLKDSDRAAVVLGAAKVDALLCSLLDHYLLPTPGTEDDLLDGDSPLGSFSARIKICYRLGLIDAHFAKLLHIFRRLRNAFAHDITSSSLSDGAARDRVMSLAAPFADTSAYSYLVRNVAQDLNRNVDDPGVMFRGVLAIFHLELQEIKKQIKPISLRQAESIVEKAKESKIRQINLPCYLTPARPLCPWRYIPFVPSPQ